MVNWNVIVVILATTACIESQPGSCPADRLVRGIQCGGPGQTCPTSSTCVATDTGTGECCWDARDPVESPCLDPMMDQNMFVTCNMDNPCPGTCHRCQDLSGVGLGLCCPNASIPGCADTAPNEHLMTRSSQSMAAVQQWSPSDASSQGAFSDHAQQSFPAGQIQNTQQDMQSFDSQQMGMGTSGFNNIGQHQQHATGSGFAQGHSQPQTSSQSNPCPVGARPISRCNGFMCPMGSQCFPFDVNGGVCCARPGQDQFSQPGGFMQQRFSQGFPMGMAPQPFRRF